MEEQLPLMSANPTNIQARQHLLQVAKDQFEFAQTAQNLQEFNAEYSTILKKYAIAGAILGTSMGLVISIRFASNLPHPGGAIIAPTMGSAGFLLGMAGGLLCAAADKEALNKSFNNLQNSLIEQGIYNEQLLTPQGCQNAFQNYEKYCKNLQGQLQPLQD